MLKVYSKAACVQCVATTRMLDKMDVQYEKINIEESPESVERIKSLGYAALPVVEMGDEHWSGFRPDLLQKAKESQ